MAFTGTDPHRGIVTAIRPTMKRSSFVFWSVFPGDVPGPDAEGRADEKAAQGCAATRRAPALCCGTPIVHVEKTLGGFDVHTRCCEVCECRQARVSVWSPRPFLRAQPACRRSWSVLWRRLSISCS